MEGETIRRAESRDLDAIVALVANAGLPVEGIHDHAGEYFVDVRGTRVVGCCGLELYGRHALLRSVAVADGERGRGTGRRLVERALFHARETGLLSVTLLTTTASGYFPRFGFREVGRDELPASVRESAEFRSVCPSTAKCMVLVLGNASVPARSRVRTTENTTATDVFRRLHERGLLVLPNAWDAGTARLVESLGAKAIATTSAGVAWAHGYADGDRLPVPRLLATVEEIARVVRVPLTVDIEGGYSSDPLVVGDVVAGVIDAGAVGINLEDGSGPPGLLAAKLERAKESGARLGVDLFVNARTDVYLRSLAPPDRRIDETLTRAERYRAAGADGIFVPGVTDVAEIRQLAAAIPLPLNVLARPGLPPAAELVAAGVRRLSAGSGIAQAVYARIAALAEGFLRDGASTPLAEGALPYARINALIRVDPVNPERRSSS